MVPGNKILTVTYGTFSCTLEGFEDPFSAMTEIAEYFRDLAAKDRFFGAEPPTPDLDKLERIAAASVPGPVEADTADGRIVLRPGEAESPLPAAAALADDPVDEPEVATFSPAEAEDEDLALEDSAAARLARLRGASAEDADPFEGYAEHAPVFDRDDASDDDVADMEADAEEEHEAAEAEAPVEPDAEIEEEPEIAAEAADDTDVDPARQFEEASTGADAPEDEPLAAIAEDVVAEEPDGDADEDEAAPAISEEASAPADAVPELEEEPEVEEEIVEETVLVVEETVETVIVEDADAPEDETVEDGEPLAEAPSLEVEEEGADEAEAEDAPEAAHAPVTPWDIPAAEAGPEPATASETLGSGADSLTSDLAALFSPRPDEDDEPELEVPDQPKARVTVRRSRRSRPLAESPAPETEAEASVEDDDEADLMAELAAIEAELARDATGAGPAGADPSDDDGDDDDEADELAAELAAIRAAEEAFDVEEAVEAEAEPTDVERLFAATDSRLSGEDASRRHANISHLKAAVAARRADDSIEPVRVDESGAYREDLANTVKPRRTSEPLPAVEEDAAEPTEERSAPLMLVSEQRVEPVAEEPRIVKPAERDIAEGLSKALRAPDPGDDFEQFAFDVGAEALPDVLEAAAVYSTTVMGQESFSRPRLLHLAAEALDDLSREDGLRGFGQLLRDGTIRKVGRGTFTLGTDSRFQRDAELRAG